MDDEQSNAQARVDGMLNVLTGVGTSKDAAAQTGYQRDPLLSQRELEGVFSGDGLGRKIIEMPAEESLRRWLTITGEGGEDVVDVMEALGTQQAVTEAYVWARLYGGSAIIRLVDDGGNLESQLNLQRINRVLGYRVVNRYEITWAASDLVEDVNSPQFGQPESYMISPSTGQNYRVHHSRISIIDGMRLPRDERARNNGWGASAMQGVWSYLMRVGSGYSYSSNITRDFVQSVLGIEGLTDLLAAGQDELVMKRINILDKSRSIMNGIVIDAGNETYTKSASSVAGLGDILDRHMEGLCGAASIPMMKLVGRPPSGLGANGETTQRDYYDGLTAARASKITRIMNDFVRDIYLSKEGPTAGRDPKQWSIKWNSMFEPSDEEEAGTRKIIAETDKLYWDIGAVDPQEIRDSRFGQGDWSSETTIEGDVDAKTENLDAAPLPLYVSRKVLNGKDVVAWAKSQGFTNITAADDMHVTITFSRAAVDWMQMGEAFGKPEQIVSEGGARMVDEFGDGGKAKVLLFNFSELSWRHEEMKNAGCSWDYAGYQPHITISVDDDSINIADVKPYTGEIVLGPEIFEILDDT